MPMTVSDTVQLNDMTTEILQSITDSLDVMNDYMEKNDKANDIDSRVDKMDIGHLNFENVIESIKAAISISDQEALTTARLSLIVNDGGSVEELEEKIRDSAERSRVSYQTTADTIYKLGLVAGDSFNSDTELIAFAELLNKSFVATGTTASEMDAALSQLTQVMATGSIQGEEFRLIMEDAPLVADAISEYMGISKDELKDLCSNGEITADIIKDSLFNAADDINQKFEQMPTTWEQVWGGFVDNIKQEFKPLSDSLSNLAKSENIQEMLEGIRNVASVAATGLAWVTDQLDGFVGSIQDNWDIMGPILLGLAAMWAVVEIAILMATIKQWAYNIAMYACPIVWIIALILGFIVAIYYLNETLGRHFGLSQTGFGMIMGSINTVIQGIIYLYQVVANVFMGMQKVGNTFNKNLEKAFKNSISGIKESFFKLGSDIMNFIAEIGEWLNKLPLMLGEFDTTRLRNLADNWAKKAEDSRDYDYNFDSFSEAYYRGSSKYDPFPENWYLQSWLSGASEGDKKINDYFDISNSNEISGTDINIHYFDKTENFLDKYDYVYSGIDDILYGTDETSVNTRKIDENTYELMKLVKDNREGKLANEYASKSTIITYDLSGMQNTYNNPGENFNPVREIENYLRVKALTGTDGVRI